MADGFTLTLDGELADLLQRRAREAGATPEFVAREALEQALFRYEDYAWTNGDPREARGPYPPGQAGCIPLEEIEVRVRKKLDERLGPA